VQVQAFPVRLPSGVTYWTVLDEDLQVVPEADAFLHQLRFGGDAAESTTESYARALASTSAGASGPVGTGRRLTGWDRS
jgi:hypothetical protein